MASGVYLPTLEDILDATQAGLDWDLDTHQWALYNATKVSAVDYNANTTYSATNEIVGSGYTARGKVVTGTAFSRPGAGVSKYSSNAVQWASSTLSGVRFIDMFAETVTTPVADPVMLGIDLVDPATTSDGTLLVTPHANGILTIDWTP